MRYPNFDDASCKEIGTEIFFAEGDEMGNIAAAKKICSNCPVLNECYEWGLHHEMYGIWGGTTNSTRRQIRSRHGIVFKQILLEDYL